MNFKWIGAIMVIVGCGGFGFSLAAAHRREGATLQQLFFALDYMECELQYRLTPLPDLCRAAAGEQRGCVRDVLLCMSRELDAQISPDAERCMQAALSSVEDIPKHTRGALADMGKTLGRFDLSGQLKGLEQVRASCRAELESLRSNREPQLRSYQTLGLCAGAALAILLV